MSVSSCILMQLALTVVEIRRVVSEIRCRPVFTFCFRNVLHANTCNDLISQNAKVCVCVCVCVCE